MESLSMLESELKILGGADGPTSIFLAAPEFTIEMLIGALIAAFLIGILGLKIFRVISALVGLGCGATIGCVIGLVAELSGGAFIGAIAGGAIVGAILCGVLKRVGAFMIGLWLIPGALLSLLPLNLITVIVAVVVGLILAIVAAIFADPMIIIATSLYGGITAGTAITGVIGFDGVPWLKYILSVALVVVCIMVQSMLQSRKVGKKEKVFAEKFREEASMESEVERARMILDDGEEEEPSEGMEESEDDLDIEITEIDLDK